MATHDDVRDIALSLPETTEDPDAFGFAVAGRGFVWLWQERVDPKRSRMSNPDVIAVRVASELEKDALIEMDPAVFFTERHYDGYAAILVRLAAIERDGWRSRAPKRLASAAP